MSEINDIQIKIPVYKKIFGTQASDLISESFLAGPYERIEIMKKFRNSFTSDNAKLLYEVFEDASGIQGPPKRLIKVLEKKTNLAKLIKQNRIKRIAENFIRVGERLGIVLGDTGANYIPIFVTTMIISYGKLNSCTKLNLEMFDTKDHNIRGMLVMALLSEYCKTVNPYDYINLGFVLFFIKTLSVYSMIQKEVFEAHPELRTYVDNILTIIERVTDYLPSEYIGELKAPNTNIEYIDGEEV